MRMFESRSHPPAEIASPPQSPVWPVDGAGPDRARPAVTVAEGDSYQRQLEALEYFKRKKQIEEEDARMAARMAQSPSPLSLSAANPERDYPQNVVPQGDVWKVVEETDAELARRIHEEEKREIEAERQNREWARSLEKVKADAMAAADAELAKLLHEKEQLEERLRNANSVVKGGEEGSGAVVLAAVEYPDYWEAHLSRNHRVSPAEWSLHEVRRDDPQWRTVLQAFQTGAPNAVVHRIQRCENLQLYTWYWLKKCSMVQKFGHPNEQWCFHGSRSDAYDIILKEGFDHRVANMGGAYGAGIYFASSSNTSLSYLSGDPKNRRMLYCRILAGHVGPGQHGLRRPPERKKGVLFDSVGTNGVYVLFENAQAYPEYLITFRDR